MNPSWQRRVTAHTEILRRGGSVLAEAAGRLAEAKHDDPAFAHLPWLAAAGGSEMARQSLSILTRDPRPEVRQQAVRALASVSWQKPPRETFEQALADADPQVQLAALTVFFTLSNEPPLDPVVKLACNPDDYLRQTATRLLARKASMDQIAGLGKSPDLATRLACVLAAGVRLTVPPSDFTPPEQLKLSYPTENAFFKVKIRYADGEADLRSLGRVGSFTTAEYWKAINPDPEQRELFQLLTKLLDDPADPVRLQAAYYLSLLRDPETEPAVAAVFHSIQERRLAAAPLHEIGKVWAIGPFADSEKGFQEPHPPEQGAVELTAEYSAADGKKASWQELKAEEGRFDVGRAFPGRDGASAYVFFRLQSGVRQPVLLLTGSDAGLKVWQNGRLAGENAKAREAKPGQDAILLDAQPGSNDVLVRVQLTAKGQRLYLQFRSQGEAAAELPDKLDGAMLAQRLRDAASGTAAIAPEFLTMDWRQAAVGGDAARGRKLFGSLGCAKCHAITADQKGGGAPSLSEAGKRFTVPYLAESILLPSKQVADAFRASTLTLADGRVLTGLVLNETADALELIQPDATRTMLLKKEIEGRKASDLSPMPVGLVKTPEELKDLLAYLLSDNPAPP
jgi:putative heme-binding domain-containing protein